jgi:ribonuclease BN (tRNA processing enzyme)
MMQDAHFYFFGVRGSYPVPGNRVVQYGGNTSSILLIRGEKIVIFDAGTGIINIGNFLKSNDINGRHLDIFLTHLHLDHIQGLPFFNPVFNSEYDIDIYCPDYHNIKVENTILSFFNNPISPISNKGIKAKLNIIELPLKKGKKIKLDPDMSVDYIKEDSHPLSGVFLYKLSVNGQKIVYATDVESPRGFEEPVVDFIRGSDILIHDSQYFNDDYFDETNPKKGFGHSTCLMAAQNALKCQVKKLYLFHYNPEYSDDKINKMLAKARKKFKNTFLSRELKKIHIRS